MRATFPHRLLPYLLVAPQLAISLVFFYWPAIQALNQSVRREDAIRPEAECRGEGRVEFDDEPQPGGRGRLGGEAEGGRDQRGDGGGQAHRVFSGAGRFRTL